MLKAINNAAKNTGKDLIAGCNVCDPKDICSWCDVRDFCRTCDSEWCMPFVGDHD